MYGFYGHSSNSGQDRRSAPLPFHLEDVQTLPTPSLPFLPKAGSRAFLSRSSGSSSASHRNRKASFEPCLFEEKDGRVNRRYFSGSDVEATIVFYLNWNTWSLSTFLCSLRSHQDPQVFSTTHEDFFHA